MAFPADLHQGNSRMNWDAIAGWVPYNDDLSCKLLLEAVSEPERVWDTPSAPKMGYYTKWFLGAELKILKPTIQRYHKNWLEQKLNGLTYEAWEVVQKWHALDNETLHERHAHHKTTHEQHAHHKTPWHADYETLPEWHAYYKTLSEHKRPQEVLHAVLGALHNEMQKAYDPNKTELLEIELEQILRKYSTSQYVSVTLEQLRERGRAPTSHKRTASVLSASGQTPSETTNRHKSSVEKPPKRSPTQSTASSPDWPSLSGEHEHAGLGICNTDCEHGLTKSRKLQEIEDLWTELNVKYERPPRKDFNLVFDWLITVNEPEVRLHVLTVLDVFLTDKEEITHFMNISKRPRVRAETLKTMVERMMAFREIVRSASPRVLQAHRLSGEKKIKKKPMNLEKVSYEVSTLSLRGPLWFSDLESGAKQLREALSDDFPRLWKKALRTLEKDPNQHSRHLKDQSQSFEQNAQNAIQHSKHSKAQLQSFEHDA